MPFEFATAARILFGPGSRRELAAIAKAFGQRALVVSGRSSERVDPLVARLAESGVTSVRVAVPGEPTVADARGAAELARAERCQMVVAVGGGSAIDAGKAAAALAANGGDPLDYLEVVGAGRPLAHPSVPFIAVPTTSGSGAEVTRNAVLTVPESGVKASLRSPLMLAQAALVDPELTYDLPPAITASTGLDALAQLIEPYLSRKATALTDAFCRDGIRRAAGALVAACRDGADARAREDMALASLFGGLALANAGLGAVHGFAAAIGARFAAPHGAVCAALLPDTVRVNVRAMRGRDQRNPALERADEVGKWLTGHAGATWQDAVAWLERLRGDLGIATLGRYGVTAVQVASITEQARRSSSMRSNPIDLTDAELADILTGAL
jgi:alcohol dehydrogenase class IV